MNSAIVIPSRYGSTRFPGKPLASLAGKTLLGHVVGVAQKAAKACGDSRVIVATEDARIFDHALALGVEAVMTPDSCLTGTDRVHAAIEQLPLAQRPEIVINYQGDAPLASPGHITALVECLRTRPHVQAVTPAVQLTWDQLDAFRESKKTTPFSGTTVVYDERGRAFWFSKTILPAIRKEMRNQPCSPVCRHIGIYGYRQTFLAQFVSWGEGIYEKLEGLEQLRILERGEPLHVVLVTEGGHEIGIDTPEDLARAEQIFKNLSL